MIRIDITSDNELLKRLAARMAGTGLDKNSIPATALAFEEVKETIRGMWARWAMGGELMGIDKIKSPSAKLSASIKTNDLAPFNAEIYSESPHAERIQKGTPELDMKTTHPYGPKSRVTKSGPNKGIPYVIIPIRWGTPNGKGGARAHFTNSIPQKMYDIVETMEMSRRLNVRKDGSRAIHTEGNYWGKPVERSEYEWGGRFRAKGNIDGMIRMENETQNDKGTYFTFRVISAAQLVTKPNSWIRKAVAPVDVIGALEKTARPLAENLIERGIKADLGI